MTDTVRVPREPTPEMLKAGASTLDDFWKAQERGPTHVQEAWPGIVQIYAAMLAASPQGKGGWTKHDGGPNPVPGKQVSVRFPDGDESLALDSECFDWSVPFLGVPEATIIAYRVTEGVKP